MNKPRPKDCDKDNLLNSPVKKSILEQERRFKQQILEGKNVTPKKQRRTLLVDTPGNDNENFIYTIRGKTLHIDTKIPHDLWKSAPSIPLPNYAMALRPNTNEGDFIFVNFMPNLQATKFFN